jgi:hypothetical protein
MMNSPKVHSVASTFLISLSKTDFQVFYVSPAISGDEESLVALQKIIVEKYPNFITGWFKFYNI